MCKDLTYIIVVELGTTNGDVTRSEIFPYERVLLIRNEGLNIRCSRRL